MASEDLERGGMNGKKRPNNHHHPPTSPYYVENTEEQWTSWLVSMFVVANVVVFVGVMYINDCPKNNLGFEGSCMAEFLGMLSFQPLRENPLFGHSSNTAYWAYLSVVRPWWEYTIFSFHSVVALITLVLIIAINLAVGILPHVDNFAHIDGFFTGFFSRVRFVASSPIRLGSTSASSCWCSCEIKAQGIPICFLESNSKRALTFFHMCQQRKTIKQTLLTSCLVPQLS
ncbi:hypothetical protein V6N11_046118 [Hibiscus sabdariffa]|uniref:RHOMBOID-like protein n=1 Tax=Hibiscus sabdariffa TaxID=183260 RepID=A0ABR1ZMM9_9ROSI